MEAIDKIEYDTNNPPPYNVKVLQEKRRKLKENWLKIYQFYVRISDSFNIMHIIYYYYYSKATRRSKNSR